MSKATYRRAAMRAGIAAAVLAAALIAATSASAYSWNVSMSAAQQAASGLPADTGASGTAAISADTAANRICGTFTWSGIHGAVGFGHIHQGERGEPEKVAYTVNLFGPPKSLSGFPSGTTGCTTLPGAVITQMARFPQEFMVTIHTTAFPAGAIRGQLGTGTLACELKIFCPPPPP